MLSRKHSDASSLSSTPTKKRRPRTALSSKHRAAAAIAERVILTKRNQQHARRRQNQHALPAFVSLADVVAATDATALDALGPGFAGYAKDGGGFYRTALASHESGDEPAAPAATNDYAAALHALDATDDGVFATMEGIAEGEHNGHAYHAKRSLAPPAGKKMRRIMREVTQDLPRQAAELLGEAARLLLD